jgi:protein TonB
VDSQSFAGCVVGAEESAAKDDALESLAACPAGRLALSSILAPRSIKRELPGGVAGALGIHFLVALFLWAGPLLSPRVDKGNTAFMVTLVDVEAGAEEDDHSAGEGVNGGSSVPLRPEPAPAPSEPEQGRPETAEAAGGSAGPWEAELSKHEEPEQPDVEPQPPDTPSSEPREPENPKAVQSKRRKSQKVPVVTRERNQTEIPAPKSGRRADPAPGIAPGEVTETATASTAGGEGAGRGERESQGDGKPGGRAVVPQYQEFQLAQLDTPPALVSRVEPDYPAMARRQRLSGKLVVKFLVDPGGRVRNASVLQADPKGVFESCVLDALSKWHFKPGLYQGRPVATWVILPIQFKVSG